MKLIFKTAALVFFSFYLVSCSESTSKELKKNKENDNLTEFNNLISAINSRSDYIEGNSLCYDNNEYKKQVKCYFDSRDKSFAKIIFYKVEMNTGNIDHVSFFFYKGHVFSSKRYQEYGDSSNITRISTISYYEKNKVIFSKEKSSKNTTLDEIEYKPCSKKEHNIEEARQILDQKGHYQTKFIQFHKIDGMGLYMEVGENIKGGYSAVLKIPENLNSDLMNINEKEIEGKKVLVEFDSKMIEKDWYQNLISCQFIE
tara:strand:- start:70 stop:840 length:771 start_codon:yes stop_codon:yes gene_type:complete